MNILYVYSDAPESLNCSNWRCFFPADAVNRTKKHHAKVIDLQTFASGQCDEECMWADIIILQRDLFGSVISTVFKWRISGKTVVLDVDDAYHAIPSDNPSSIFWNNKLARSENGHDIHLPFDPQKDIINGARIVNAVTSPSDLLCSYWLNYAPSYLVPNYFPIGGYISAKQNIETPNRVVVGWGGSVSHVKSFVDSNIIPALRKIASEHNDIQIVIAGGGDGLINKLKIKNMRVIEWTPMNNWYATLNSFTVGVAPLAGTYDNFRSWIKVMEYMLMRKPWVASNVFPYQSLDQFGTLVRNKTKDWESAILDAVYHPDEQKINSGYCYALQQDIDLNIEKVIAIYQKVIDDKRPLI